MPLRLTCLRGTLSKLSNESKNKYALLASMPIFQDLREQVCITQMQDSGAFKSDNVNQIVVYP